MRPPLERVAEVQQRLVELTDLVEDDPARTIVAIQPLIDETATWPNRRAFVWASHVACQALRFLDRLDEAAGIAEAAVRVAAESAPELVVHLALEHGTALRQAGHVEAARVPLERALAAFEAEGDQSAVATTLVELGVSARLSGDLDLSQALLENALRHAEASGSDRTARRARRERGVSLRHAGRARESVEVLTAVLATEPGGSHGRANTLNELAASEVQLNLFGQAQAHYGEAGDLYAIHSDRLGSGNVARALGNLAAQLSRYGEAIAHLDDALSAYRAGAYVRSEANARWDRALVRLAQGDARGAMDDSVAAWRTFVRFGDPVSESGALRTLAQVANAHGRAGLRDRALARSLRLSRSTSSPLAVANTLLHTTILDADPVTGLGHATEAVTIYERLELPVGVMQAASRAAEHALAVDDHLAALRWASVAVDATSAGRWRMRSAVDRADYGYTAQQATSRIYGVLATIASPEAEAVASALVAEDGPVALAHLFQSGKPARLPTTVQSAINRLRRTDDPRLRRGHLRGIAAALTELDEFDRTTVGLLAPLVENLGPDDGLLISGTPAHGLAVPTVWATAADGPRFFLLPLDEPDMDAIDALGRLAGESVDALALLWDPRRTHGWTRRLADALLPPPAIEWLTAAGQRQLQICAHQSLAHVPFEALSLDGHPVGSLVAVERVPARVPPDRALSPTKRLGYGDPALDTAAERDALGSVLETEPGALRNRLGPDQLAWVCCHGTAGIDLDARLATSEGQRVLDAGDILGHDLTGTTLVMETCWSGRHFGRPFAEGLTLATAALLAGAASVATGLFPLPANPACTGAITAHLIRSVRRGHAAPAALRAARSAYLTRPPDTIALSDMNGEPVSIPGDAPLAWAGLVTVG